MLHQFLSISLSNEAVIQQLKSDIAEFERFEIKVWIFIFFIVVFFCGVVVFLWRQNKLLKRKRTLEILKADLQKSYTENLIKIQEEERKKFAKELHDSLGSLVTTLKNQIEQFSEPSPSTEVNKILVKDIQEELRNICNNIMPSTLVNSGLKAAIENLLFKINTLNKLNIEFHIYGLDQRIHQDIEINVYRIIQELLNNLLKYSDADWVSLQINKIDDSLNIILEDNGFGFDIAEQRNKKSGNGLKNIFSRVFLLNGQIEYDSKSSKKGNTVIIDLPLNNSNS
jgi:signal transduction histidine kinase